MATTVLATEPVIQPDDRNPGGGGPLEPGPGGHGGGDDREDENQNSSAGLYRLGLRLTLLSISSLFITLIVVYFVRTRSRIGWQPIGVPSLLWMSTVLIVASSISLESARGYLERNNRYQYGRRLLLTTSLGLAFLISQLLSLRQLIEQGFYLRGNPHTSLFYVFTGFHGVHVLGGMAALHYLLMRSRRRAGGIPAELRSQQVNSGLVALYWHFMDAVWICLFILLLLWS